MEASTSPINAPHTDDPNPDDFFGDGGEDTAAAQQAEAAAAADAAEAPEPEVGPAEPAGTPDVPIPDVAPGDATPPEPTPEPSPATPPAEAPAAEPAPGGEPATAPAEAPAGGEGAAQPAATAAAAAPEASSGTVARNYVVLREITLTPDVLRTLLTEAEQGDAGSYRKGYFVLDTVEARNVKTALGAAYGQHRDRLGNTADLVPVPERQWQVKHVAPKKREVESLDIS